jgi:hypothetical protein
MVSFSSVDFFISSRGRVWHVNGESVAVDGGECITGSIQVVSPSEHITHQVVLNAADQWTYLIPR